MADEEDTNEVEEDTKKSSKSKLKLVIIIVSILVFQVVLTGAGFYFYKGSGESHAELEEPEIPIEEIEMDPLTEELEGDEELMGAIFPIETFIINTGKKGYLRAQLQLQFISRDVPRKIYSRIPIIRDSVISLVMQKERKDIDTNKGKDKLREEIVSVGNKILGGEVIKTVLFSQYVVR